MFIDHVAFVVSSLESALEAVTESGAHRGPIDEFPAEGTRECYVGDRDHSAKLLLIQPIAHGPYASALKRRGPGLHHLGVDVPDIDTFLDGLADTGWYLHSKSFRTRADSLTVWLARPGVATLVEVHQRSAADAAPLLSAVRVDGLEPRLASIFAGAQLPVSAGSPSAARLGEHWFAFV